MKAILIDPFTKTVSEVKHNGNYQEIYKFIKADCFDVVRISEHEAIYVDDEGLYRQEKFFAWDGYPQPLAGRGLVLGSDDEGNSVSTKLTLDEVRSKVTWPDVRYTHQTTQEGYIDHPIFGRAFQIVNTPHFAPNAPGEGEPENDKS